MSESIDLTTLSKEQLIGMLQVREQALKMNYHADEMLLQKMEAGLNADDLENYLQAKQGIVLGLMQAEEQIMGSAAQLVN